MNNEIKQFKVQSSDPYFTANKWNESLDYSINFEKIIKKILGPKFKGIYKANETYNKYDYVWSNDSLYQIIESVDTVPKVTNSNGVSNVYEYKDGILCLNNRNEIIYDNSKENVLINSKFDSFCYDYKSNSCYGIRDNRIYSVNLESKEVKLLNLIFGSNIKIDKILCDESNIYIKSKTNIYKSIFSNEESTYFDVLYTGENIIDFDISDDFIFIVDSSDGVLIISKTKTNEVPKKVNTFISIGDKVKISAIDNNTFAIYDGLNHIFTYFNNGSGIYNLESNIIEYEGLNSGLNSFTRGKNNLVATSLNNIIISIPSNKYSIEEVDISHLTTRKSNVELDYKNISCHLPFKNGYYTFKGKDYISKSLSNHKYINYLPSVENNSKIVFDFSQTPFTTLLIKLKTSSSGNVGVLSLNGMNYNISIPQNYDKEISVFIEQRNNKVYQTIISYDSIKEIILNGSSTTTYNGLNISSNYTTSISELVLFTSKLKMSYKDYLANNIIIPTIDINNNTLTPYSNVHLDSNGNIPLKTKDTSIIKSDDGIYVNLSDSENSNSREIAFSTAGAKVMYDKMVTNIEETLKGFSGKSHKHYFYDILEVPTANQNDKGIVSLAFTISDSTITAATPKSVKDYCSKFSLNSHVHNYSEIKNVPPIPIATTYQKGITTLSNSINDSTDTAVTPKSVKDFTNNNFSNKNHKHGFYDLDGIPTSSTGAKGIVQLQSYIDGNNSTACTPGAVQSKLGEYLHKSSGGTVGGTLNTNNLTTNNLTVGGWRIEVVKV